MAGITIERLTISGFRAYLHQQEVALRQHATPKSLAVLAPNAKGKSSLVDALEFFFSEEGTLERLGQRRSGRQAGREALEHVKAQDQGIASAVGVAFHSEEGAFEGSRSVTAYDRPMPEAAERVTGTRKVDFIIRGYQLRHFVDRQEPSERYKEVSAWFGLSALLDIQSNLIALRRNIKETLDTDRATKERLRDLKTATANAITTWNENAVIAWVTEHYIRPLDKKLSIAALDDGDAGYQTVKSQKEAEEQTTGLATLKQVLLATHAVYEKDAPQEDGTTKDVGALPAFNEAVEALTQAAAKEEEERVASAKAVFKDVWESAQKLLDDPTTDLKACPVCDTPFPDTAKGSRGAVALHIRTELEKLQTYRDAYKALQKAQKTLRQRVQALKTALATLETVLASANFSIERKVVEVYTASLSAWKEGEALPDAKTVTSTLSKLGSQLEKKIKQKVERQGEHTWATALDKLDALIEFKNRFAYIQRFRKELQALHDNLIEQETFIAGRMRTYSQSVIDTLKNRVNEIFQAVHSTDDAPNVRLELNPETRRPELVLLLDFAPNRQGVPPSGYLSDSQIHTLALSLRLAAIQMFNTNVPLIVLDDVVTSYDADHRRAIAGMLADQFPNHQIILVTHDERFFAYLKEQLPQERWIYKRITQLDPDFGPLFHDHKVADELVENNHALDQSAVNEMRQAEEEWLLQVCRDFGVDVRIRDVHRPYEYSRAELADALARFLRAKRLTPPVVPGVANRFLNTLQTGTVENFGSHFQDNPYGFGAVGDERTRWAEFKAFRDAFCCPACNRKRFKRPLGMDCPVCRHSGCETQFVFQ